MHCLCGACCRVVSVSGQLRAESADACRSPLMDIQGNIDASIVHSTPFTGVLPYVEDAARWVLDGLASALPPLNCVYSSPSW